MDLAQAIAAAIVARLEKVIAIPKEQREAVLECIANTLRQAMHRMLSAGFLFTEPTAAPAGEQKKEAP